MGLGDTWNPGDGLRPDRRFVINSRGVHRQRFANELRTDLVLSLGGHVLDASKGSSQTTIQMPEVIPHPDAH